MPYWNYILYDSDILIYLRAQYENIVLQLVTEEEQISEQTKISVIIIVICPKLR